MYMKRMTRLCTLLVLGFSGTVMAALPRASAVPGGVLVVDLADAAAPVPEAAWQDRKVLVLTDAGRHKAVVGVALSVEPGNYSLQVREPGGAERALPVRIVAKKYAEQKLKVPQSQ